MKVTACEWRKGQARLSPTSTWPEGARAVLTESAGRTGGDTSRRLITLCSELKKAKNDDGTFRAASARLPRKARRRRKSFWQLPFHPRDRARRMSPGEAFQCFLRGRRADAQHYIRKNEFRTSNFSEEPQRRAEAEGGRRAPAPAVESFGAGASRSCRVF